VPLAPDAVARAPNTAAIASIADLIYLDYAATTPVDPAVVQAMIAC
jgi:selenocysteine lyase/cysteine desulfurase